VVQNGVAHKWWGSQEPAAAMAAYMRLPMAQSADEAVRILDRALTLSLHFVIADAAGEARHRTCGHIPRGRKEGALVPVQSHTGTYAGEALPRFAAEDGIVVSANEARFAPDGGVLSTLAQPSYRLDRITQVLQARRDHDVRSMQALQLDVFSLQAAQLARALASLLPAGELRSELLMWDYCYTEASLGATAYDRVYRAAVRALAPKLGGPWWLAALARTELSVWWCQGIDTLLARSLAEPWWRAAFAKEVDHSALEPWGLVHTFSMPHLLFGEFAGRGPFPLAGALTTVRQGNNVPALNGVATTAPAYRFVADLGEDCAYTSVAGGIDGSVRSPSYTTWLDDWLGGTYHRLVPPMSLYGSAASL
jgi:penicillin amidase